MSQRAIWMASLLSVLLATADGSRGAAHAQTAGPNAPTTLANDASSGGTQSWMSLTLPTSSVMAVMGAEETLYLKTTGFGFAIPAGAVIKGIEVSLERAGLTSSPGEVVADLSVRIVKAGAIGSFERASPDTWPPGPLSDTATYGGPADLWGDTWTASDVNAADFGFAIAAYYAGAVSGVAAIDSIEITVRYASCSPSPLLTCVSGFQKAKLSVDERAPSGSEKLIFKAVKGPAIPPATIGDPLVSGGTTYSVCIYDDSNALAGLLSVNRAGEFCSVGKKCWKALGGGSGYKYKDLDLAADGVFKLILKAPPGGVSKAILKAKGDVMTLPLGIAAALDGSTNATVQLVPNNASSCLTATLSSIVKNTTPVFKAKYP